MNLRAYTLAVSFAATIGLLVTVAPLVRSLLEYRSPQFVDAKPELASLETFVLAKGKLGLTEEMFRSKMLIEKWGYMLKVWDRGEWQAMYEAEREQHFHAVRLEAGRSLIAYGTVFALCIGLLIVHLRWALRLHQ